MINLSALIKNHYFQALIGIISLLIGLTQLFTSSETTVSQISYKISSPVLLSSIKKDNDLDLELLWKGKKIENLYLTTISFWNGSDKFIDKKSISETDPIQLRHSNEIEIISASFYQKSRDSLNFELSINDELKSIIITLQGDDAIEVNDGGKIKILHTGSANAAFEITGRIKGTNENFVLVKNPKTDTFGIVFSTIMLMPAMFILVIVGLIVLQFLKKPKEAASLNGLLWLAISIVAIALIMVLVNSAIEQYTSIDVYPPWY